MLMWVLVIVPASRPAAARRLIPMLLLPGRFRPVFHLPLTAHCPAMPIIHQAHTLLRSGQQICSAVRAFRMSLLPWPVPRSVSRPRNYQTAHKTWLTVILLGPVAAFRRIASHSIAVIYLK